MGLGFGVGKGCICRGGRGGFRGCWIGGGFCFCPSFLDWI